MSLVTGQTEMGAFWRALGAYGASEMVAKLSRFGVIVVVARTMDPAAIGLAAAAMASGEILKAFTENGLCQRVIAAPEDRVEAVAATAHRLGWFWCLGLASLQIALAIFYAAVTGDVLIAGLIALLALEYLFMPGGLVQAALAMREGRMTETAAIIGGQVVAQNLLTVALVLIWPHPVAIVAPKVLSAPFWLMGMRRLRPWKRCPDAGLAPLRPFLRFGAPVIGIQIVHALKDHGDKLVIGGLLGMEALGIYYFAYNAGLGLAQSVSRAFSIVLFPHLCRAGDRDAAMARAMRVALLILAPVVALQALMAPLYVPIVFGSQWTEIAGLVAILCMMAIPGLFWSSAAQALRAAERTGTEFAISAMLGASLMAGTVIAAPHGLEAVAWTQLGVATLLQIAGAWPAIRLSLFRPLSRSPQP